MAEKTVYIIDLNDKVTPKLKGIEDEAAKTDSVFAKLKSSMGGMGGILAGAFSAVAIKDFIVNVTQTTAKFQGLSNSIKFASDSAQQGDLSMQWLGNLSKTYGLELEGLTEGFRTFQGAMIKTKFTSNEVRTMFRQVSTGAVAMGLSADDSKGVFLALGQIMGKGKVQAEELRGQIGERVPGAFAIAARAMGMTTSQLDKFMSEGKLLAEDFLPKFAEEMEKTFGSGAAANADSLNASLNRASNSWTELMLVVGNSSGGVMTGTLKLWSMMLDGIADQFKTIKDFAKQQTNDDVLRRIGNKEKKDKERVEYLKSKGYSRDEIEADILNSNNQESEKYKKRIADLKNQIKEKEILYNVDGPASKGGMGKEALYNKDLRYKNLINALETLEQIEKARQGGTDKIISALYMPKSSLPSDVTKTKTGKAGGLSLNESRNGETHITFNIDTFQKNEFSKDVTGLNNSVVKNFLDQMADGLATVLNDAQISARQY